MTAVASMTAYAYVSLTVTVPVAYTDVRCPGRSGTCRNIVMGIPGAVMAEARIVANNAARSGRGNVAVCRSCKALVEVIVHRSDAR